MNPVPLRSRHHIRETEGAGERNKRVGGEERRKEGKRREKRRWGGRKRKN